MLAVGAFRAACYMSSPDANSGASSPKSGLRVPVHELAALPHYHPTLAEIWTYPAAALSERIPAHSASSSARWTLNDGIGRSGR